MPKVGRKTYPYSPAGEQAAKQQAAKTGKPLVRVPPPKKRT